MAAAGVEIIDAVLVPAGLLVLLLYHAQLVYRVINHPTTTVLGVNRINRSVWVRIMMQDNAKNGILAVQTLRNNIMASTLLGTATIMLCSVIAVLITSVSHGGSENVSLMLGDKRTATTYVKLLCVLICFLIAFLCNVQSIRYYNHVSFLISIPLGSSAPGLTPEYVNKAMARGGDFWAIGLRSVYFSFPMFLWFFGPIPMFLCSVILAILLHFLDTAKDFKQTFDGLQLAAGQGSTLVLPK